MISVFLWWHDVAFVNVAKACSSDSVTINLSFYLGLSPLPLPKMRGGVCIL